MLVPCKRTTRCNNFISSYSRNMQNHKQLGSELCNKASPTIHSTALWRPRASGTAFKFPNSFWQGPVSCKYPKSTIHLLVIGRHTVPISLSVTATNGTIITASFQLFQHSLQIFPCAEVLVCFMSLELVTEVKTLKTCLNLTLEFHILPGQLGRHASSHATRYLRTPMCYSKPGAMAALNRIKTIL